MKSLWKILVLTIALTTLVLAGCGGGGSNSSQSGTQPATLSSINVTTTAASVAAGRPTQFTATGHYSDSTTKDLSSTVTWTSSDETVARISATGAVTTVKAGTVTITAKSGTVTGTSTLTVTVAELTSVAVSPSAVTLGKGQTQQLTLKGSYTDTSTLDVTGATWESSAPTVADVDANGVVTAKAIGTADITGASGQLNSKITVTVTAPVVTDISIVPNTASIASGMTQQFTAYGTYSDGSSKDITNEATWSSSATNIATVSATGLASGVSQGQANISAASGGVTRSIALTVTQAVLQSIDITPDAPSIPAGGKVQFTATGVFSDQTTQDLTNVIWSSSDESVAKIGSDGIADGLVTSSEPVTITATVGSINDTTTLTVTAATLVSVAIAPEGAHLAKGTNQQYTATGTFTDGSQQDAAVTWDSSDKTVATINTYGLAQALAEGNTTISAKPTDLPEITTSLTVTPAVVSEILVTPALPTTGIGGAVQFSATAIFSDQTTQDVSSLVTWTSSSAAVATISNAGLATTLSAGEATITATYTGVSGSTTLTVSPARLQSIIINNIPSAPTAVDSLRMGLRAKMQLYAWGVFNDGTKRPLASVSWSSTAGKYASVSAAGLVRSKRRTGSTTIRAMWQGVTGTLPITVSSASITAIQVRPADSSLPASPTIGAGTGIQLVAIATFDDDTTQNIGSYAYWTTSDYTTATVTNAGFARGVKPGTATISVTYEGVTGSTTLTVTEAVLDWIDVQPWTATIPLGTAQPFTARGVFSDGSQQDLTYQVTWSSTNVGVAVIDRYGVAVSAGRGTTNIKAIMMRCDTCWMEGDASLNVN